MVAVYGSKSVEAGIQRLSLCSSVVAKEKDNIYIYIHICKEEENNVQKAAAAAAVVKSFEEIVLFFYKFCTILRGECIRNLYEIEIEIEIEICLKRKSP